MRKPSKHWQEAEKLFSLIQKGISLVKGESTTEGEGKLAYYLHNQLASDTKPLRDSIHKAVENDLKLVDESFRIRPRQRPQVSCLPASS